MPNDSDKLSFPLIYSSHRNYVLQCLRRRGVSAMDVEDLAHEVFIIAFRRISCLRDRHGARLWLAGIARYCAISWHRSGRRQRRKYDAYAKCLAIEPNYASPDRQFTWVILMNWLKNTDDVRLRLWLLVEWVGMTAREVGEHTKTNPNTIRSRIRAFRLRVIQEYQ